MIQRSVTGAEAGRGLDSRLNEINCCASGVDQRFTSRKTSGYRCR